jgi:hypothetical protein
MLWGRRGRTAGGPRAGWPGTAASSCSPMWVGHTLRCPRPERGVSGSGSGAEGSALGACHARDRARAVGEARAMASSGQQQQPAVSCSSSIAVSA